MNVSFIATIYDEESTIYKLLNSLLDQSKIPDEIIIVDGGSTDGTLRIVKDYLSNIKNKNIKSKIIVKKGNRAVGRNVAIINATNEIIVCSDAGCVLGKNWIKNIVEPFSDPQIDVVAGYYKGKPKNIFQKCLIPYVLVMEDKINPNNFLPATRSMAFKKAIWKKIGGFDKRLSNNEDYAFAHELVKVGAKIVFARSAVVYWKPRKTFKEAFIMFFRFAFGDAEAKIWRTSIILLFSRYFFGLFIITLSFLYTSFFFVAFFLLLIVFYLGWSIKKNYHYVSNKKAIFILPSLQLMSDIAVLTGTVFGSIKTLTRFK